MTVYGASDLGLLTLAVFVSEFILVLGIEHRASHIPGKRCFTDPSPSCVRFRFMFSKSLFQIHRHSTTQLSTQLPGSSWRHLMAAGSLIGISWYPAGTQCPLSMLPAASSNTNNLLGPCMVRFTGESGFDLGIQLGRAGLWVLALCCYVQQPHPTSTHRPSFLTI